MCIGRLSFCNKCKWIETQKMVSIDVRNWHSTAQHSTPQPLRRLLRYFATLSRLFLGAAAGETAIGSAGVELAVRREAGSSQAEQYHAYEQSFFRFHHFKFEMNRWMDEYLKMRIFEYLTDLQCCTLNLSTLNPSTFSSTRRRNLFRSNRRRNNKMRIGKTVHFSCVEIFKVNDMAEAGSQK